MEDLIQDATNDLQEDLVSQFNPNWRNILTTRQTKEVELALTYVNQFNHGTPSHNHYELIALLARQLDSISQVALLATKANQESAPPARPTRTKNALEKAFEPDIVGG